MTSRIEEDFELELRSLNGVLNVGMTHRDNGDVDVVTLVVAGQDPVLTRDVATQIASLYYPEAAIVVDDTSPSPLTRGGDGARVVLISAEYDASEGICKVHLIYQGRAGIGTSRNGPLIGGAEATLAALRDLDFNVPFSLMAVVNVATVSNWPVIVTLRSLHDDTHRFGVAEAEEDLVAAARATLDALNRFLSGSDGRL